MKLDEIKATIYIVLQIYSLIKLFLKKNIENPKKSTKRVIW